MKAPNLQEMDEVALQKEIPEHELRYGDIGVIMKSYREGCYDVDFENAYGKRVVVRNLSKEGLLLVRNFRE